jgi:hypothetical protein
MEIAVTIVALVEIAVLLASFVALLVFGIRKIVRGLRNLVRPEDDLATKGGGIASVRALLVQLGMPASEDDARRIAAAVKAHWLKHQTALTHGEFRDLAESVIGRTAASALR